MKFCPDCASPLDDQVKESRQRRVCPDKSCGFVHWNNPTAVVAAIIVHEKKVMLVHHVGWPPKALALVTGFLESGETPEQGVIREVKEETGLETSHIDFVGHYSFPQQNQLIIAFAVYTEGEISLNEELDRYKLLEPSSVKAWEFGTGPALKDWLSHYSTHQKDES